MLELALQSSWFKKSRLKQEHGKKPGMSRSGGGLGMKERPGLGAESSTRVQDSTSFSSYRASNSLQGPQSDRISAMKHAFANQFKSNFVAAVDSAPKVVPVGVHAPQNPDPEPHIVPLKRRKKTRWE